MNYYKMDSLKACITSKDMFMHMPGQSPKIAAIDGDNSQMVDIMRKQPSITKEEFEQSIPSSTSYEAFYKAMYLAAIEN